MAIIRQLVKQQKKKKPRAKSSKPRVKNQDRWFLKQIDSVLGYTRPWKAVQKFYPSALGNRCDRYLYFAYHGGLPAQEVTPQTQRIFDTGGAFETRMEKYLRKAGLFLAAEQTLKFDNPPISGRYDFLIRYKATDRAIVELKTINARGLENLIDQPKPEHVIQLQIYLNLMGLKNGIVVYENKNDQDMKAFKIVKDKKVWDEILERCIRIMNMTPNEVPLECTGEFYCACREVKDENRNKANSMESN